MRGKARRCEREKEREGKKEKKKAKEEKKKRRKKDLSLLFPQQTHLDLLLAQARADARSDQRPRRSPRQRCDPGNQRPGIFQSVSNADVIREEQPPRGEADAEPVVPVEVGAESPQCPPRGRGEDD